MTAIPSIAGLTSPSSPTSGTTATMMDQNDFLRLMTTQLTTQDPFNPVDNTQMVAQMAQFSQVAGIAEMNRSLQAIAASLGTSRLGDAASWIGRSMLVESDVTTPLRDGTYAGEIALPEGAEDVTVSFVDANGDIWEAGVDTSAELIEMVEAARQYQNNVQVLQTAKTLTLDTLRLGQ